MVSFNGLNKRQKINPTDTLRIEIELAWSRPEISKDFSLQTWSNDKQVSILHTDEDLVADGFISDNF